MKSKKECKHLNVGKEYLYGMQTGDIICYDCNETFSPEFWKIIQANRKNHKEDPK